MVCEVCGERDATVHLTQMLGGAVKKLHLCEECAEQSGINVSGSMSLSDMLFGMGLPEEPEGAAEKKKCQACQLTRADFRKTSRLGCPACYEAFAAELAPLLTGLHKAGHHVGKVPSAEQVDVPATAEVEGLQKQLKEAVAGERYEEAARLRDLIREEKKKVPAPKARRRRRSDGG
jgi:protein arginine kinase activator